MYMPAFNAFLQNFGIDMESFNSAEKVEIPKSLLKFMLQLLLTHGSFNEVGYLKLNPDVEVSVKQGALPNARIHYIGYGFFEGRLGATPEVDEEWYRQVYADVEQGIRQGLIGSAVEHFLLAGAAEGRSPNAHVLPDATQWKRAFGR